MNPNSTLARAMLCTLAGACTPPAPDGPPATAEAPPSASPNRIEIPATVRRNLGITFAKVEPRRVAQTLRVPGSFELRQLARREYRMALPGRVELHVDQYEVVEPGQVLFRFESPAWPELLHEIITGEQAIATAGAEIAVAEAKVLEVRTKLELVQARIDALAQSDFKKADLAMEAAELDASLPRLLAELELARTRLTNARRTREHALHRAATAADIPEGELEREVQVGEELVPMYQTIDWIEVRAVSGGVVEHLAVTDGSFVEPTAAVLATIDRDQVRFRALALQADLPALRGALGSRIVPPESPGMQIGDGVEATMTFGLEAHPEERTMTLLATPAQLAPWIQPGVSAFLEIVVDSSEAPALAIPRSAIVREGLHHVFFRRDPQDPNAAIRTEADMGVSDGRWVTIRSGLARGDEVVLAGAYELKLALDQSGAGPSSGGHVHADGTEHGAH